MKSQTILFFLIFIPGILYSQKEFKTGYIITKDFELVEGLIANFGEEDSSNKYVFKKSKKDSLLYLNTNNVREFGIRNQKKFVLAQILLEISDSQVLDSNDTTEYTLKWMKKNAFLEILIEGESTTLYYYYNSGVDNFYVQMNKSKLIPLIYKQYSVLNTHNNDFTTEFVENNTYITTLKNLLKCPNENSAVKKVSYTRKSMVNFIKKYFECNNEKYTVYYEGKPSTRFNFKLAYLLTFTDFGANNGTTEYFDFTNGVNHTFGAEIEYMIPFNKYRWSVFVEADYQFYKDTYIHPYTNIPTSIDYKVIEMPVGISYHIHLNHSNSLFLRAAIIPNIVLDDSYIAFYTPGNKYDLDGPVNAYVGAGYAFKRFAIEYRYYSTQNLTESMDKNTHDSDFDHMSLRVSFTFAKTK